MSTAENLELPRLTSTLQAVTVYREGAVCTRVAALDATATAGATRVCVGALPLCLVPGSLRARVVEPGGAAVLDVRASFDVDLGAEIDLAAEQRALEDAIAQREGLVVRLARLDAAIAELGELVPRFREPPRREPPRPAAVATMLALGDLVDARADTLAAERRSLRRELDDAQERERLCQRRLAEASTAARTQRAKVARAAVVTLTGPIAQPCTLAIDYQVPGARWVPSYQLALDDRGGGSLTMRAAIAQATGEDWTAIALSLSTASLSRRTSVPELQSRRIGRKQPEPPRAGWREPPPGLEGLFADYDGFAASDPTRRTTNAGSIGARPPLPAAPPMPPPPAAPPPVPMMAAPAAAPAALLAGMPGGVPMPQPMARRSAPAPAAEQAASTGMFASLSRAEPSRGGGGAAFDGAMAELSDEGGADLELPGLPPAPSPDANLLDYGGLQLAGLDDEARRGRLVPAPAIAVALALATRVRVQVDMVATAVVTAERIAGAVAMVELPRDCLPVSAQDRFDYRYDCRGPVDVAATGRWITVPVADCAVTATPLLVCVPAVEPQVYRTLELVNASPRALLPGPVDVVAAGQFLLTTSLPAIPPGGRGRRLGLGVEEAVKVARNTRYEETTGGIFGGQSVLPHTIEIELANRLARAVDIEVLERVPVVDANEKDLKIEEHDATPAWQEIEGPHDGVVVHGLRRWRVAVAAGATTTLVAKYSIRMPGDRMLVGGNRRS
ncbi:MAG: mucoidy inhibitor MuiA family protein [Nannocystaceae bacterium]|nr:mucoidy inhibitor MuiA family protein [Nannocystaceae bacterium]